VFGESGKVGGFGVVGDGGSGGTGVHGEGSGTATGVHGKSNSGFGVLGESPVGPVGTGVVGLSTSGTGVGAISDTGAGIDSRSSVGPVVLAKTVGAATQPAVQANSSAAAQPAVRATGNVVAAATGTGAGHAAALVVQGSAAFTRSGVLTIPAGAMSAATPLIAGGLSATAHVLATCQTHVASGAQPQIQSAVPFVSTSTSADKGKIRIYLAAAAPTGGVKVAWFVFG
jgi:hypothetical protein